MATDREQLAACRLLAGRLHQTLAKLADAAVTAVPVSIMQDARAALNHNEPEALELLGDVRTLMEHHMGDGAEDPLGVAARRVFAVVGREEE